jgi:ribosomal protein S18 acetylase RimI-like enzyme
MLEQDDLQPTSVMKPRSSLIPLTRSNERHNKWSKRNNRLFHEIRRNTYLISAGATPQAMRKNMTSLTTTNSSFSFSSSFLIRDRNHFDTNPMATTSNISSSSPSSFHVKHLPLSRTRIQHVIGEMLDAIQQGTMSWPSSQPLMSSAIITLDQTAAFADYGHTFADLSNQLLLNPKVMVPRSYNHIPQQDTSQILFRRSHDRLIVRTASSDDDIRVAALRLSVFSGFSPEIQGQFCLRSCEAIAKRRRRGAVCVVATAPRLDIYHNDNKTTSRRRDATISENDDIVLGTAECSFHEFFGTQLGRRRRRRSLLYVTEVAVHPDARRKGVGLYLMEGVEALARRLSSTAERKGLDDCVETLFLHVDVLNDAAISLYKKAGYRRVESLDRFFLDFTTSLNLHPGATKGRNHDLYYKDLVTEPQWLPDPMKHEPRSQQQPVTSSRKWIGFELS